MPFYLQNAEKIMLRSMKGQSEARKEIISEELKFLKNMKNERTMSFDKKDRTNAVLEARQLKRKAQQIARVESAQKRKAIESLPKEKNDYTNVEDETEEQPSTSSETKRKHRREIKTGSTAFWPHNVLQNQSVVQEAI